MQVSWSSRAVLLAGVSWLLALSGCGSVLTEGTSAGAGVAGAGIASAVTKNGSVTAAIGLGTQAAAATALGFVERSVHADEQQRIASVAGPLPIGGVAHWSVDHAIPIEADAHGEVAVSREISAAPLACREIVFSVDQIHKHQSDRQFFVTDICRDGKAWRWASAEPAVARWGTLQ
ncbi:hypothetical protein ACELLULO517_16410 [Acidisoma cellulosilytica]|uniref:Uncharacterized protein n=1 Tax=Acidisoma cellulosilyticum TaxID=2802395 RepID=A0A963Z4M9_9PROT|nr:hypothetical protein [Acidisoma cellulosilyticum]MCB8881832.1 hypothetical protein [Acidisoma cellulosilyticum]